MYLFKIILLSSFDYLSHRIHGTGIVTFIYHKNRPFMSLNIPYMDSIGWISFASRLVVGRHRVLRVRFGTNVGPMGPMIDGE